MLKEKNKLKYSDLKNKKVLKKKLKKIYKEISSSYISYGYRMESLNILDIIDKLNNDDNFEDKLFKYFYSFRMMIDKDMLSKRNIFKDIENNINLITPELENMKINNKTSKVLREEKIIVAMNNLSKEIQPLLEKDAS
tara:strand:+ start:10206 stop:10619 length:414 start_codon:yes stop_codon:yes gene_type:complete